MLPLLLWGVPGAVASAVELEPDPAQTITSDEFESKPPDHVVVVVFENKDRKSVIGSDKAPYFNELAAQGANMSASYGVTHPSQPNYIALFSGDQRGVTSNSCPKKLGDTDNLGSQLIEAGHTFIGYSEALPSVGFTGCDAAAASTSASTARGSTSATSLPRSTSPSPPSPRTSRPCRRCPS